MAAAQLVGEDAAALEFAELAGEVAVDKLLLKMLHAALKVGVFMVFSSCVCVMARGFGGMHRRACMRHRLVFACHFGHPAHTIKHAVTQGDRLVRGYEAAARLNTIKSLEGALRLANHMRAAPLAERIGQLLEARMAEEAQGAEEAEADQGETQQRGGEEERRAPRGRQEQDKENEGEVGRGAGLGHAVEGAKSRCDVVYVEACVAWCVAWCVRLTWCVRFTVRASSASNRQAPPTHLHARSRRRKHE